jgi:hemoglobin
MQDIQNIEDIKILVDSFYQKVRNNELLAPVFNEKIQNNWPQHLEKMYRFWQTILLEEHTYSGSPFPPHATLLIAEEHFGTWLELFMSTIEEHFVGERANEAKLRAGLIAKTFHFKIESLRNISTKSLL